MIVMRIILMIVIKVKIFIMAIMALDNVYPHNDNSNYLKYL